MTSNSEWPVDGVATIDDLARLTVAAWDRHEGAAAPCERHVFELLTTAYFASLYSNEGRATQFRVLLSPDNAGPRRMHFSEPLQLTARELSKLAPCVGIGSRMLDVRGFDGVLKIAGFHDVDVDRMSQPPAGTHPRRHSSLLAAVHAPGVVKVSVPSSVRLELLRDRIRASYSLAEIDPITRFVNIAARFVEPGSRAESAAAIVHDLLSEIVFRIQSTARGGCLLIVPAVERFRAGHLVLKYHLNTDLIRASVQRLSQLALNPSFDSRSSIERDLARAADLVVSLAATDGAVVIDRQLGISGFGAEIRAQSDLREVVEIHSQTPAAMLPRTDVSQWGMRHRSAAYLCDLHDKGEVVAIVLSQDGEISVFSKESRGVVRYLATTPTRWL